MPAFIAFSLRVFGSAKIGIASLAALEIPAAYGFTKELLGNWRVALTTCVFLAFTPMFLLHSALVLSYVLSLLGLTSGGLGTPPGDVHAPDVPTSCWEGCCSASRF